MRKDDLEEAELERERQAQADREEEEEEERKRKRERQAQEEEEKKEEEEEERRRARRANNFGYWSEMDPEEYARRAATSKRVEKGVAFALLGFGVAAIAGGLLCAVAAITGTGRYRE